MTRPQLGMTNQFIDSNILAWPELSNLVPGSVEKSEANVNKREFVQEKISEIAPGLGILTDLIFWKKGSEACDHRPTL